MSDSSEDEFSFALDEVNARDFGVQQLSSDAESSDDCSEDGEEVSLMNHKARHDNSKRRVDRNKQLPADDDSTDASDDDNSITTTTAAAGSDGEDTTVENRDNRDVEDATTIRKIWTGGQTSVNKHLRKVTGKSDKGGDTQKSGKQQASTGPLSEATSKGITWSDLHLSRPLQRALVKLGWDTPTDIQLRGIPPALEGNDILGTAETGSGKTAAFLLPILERLLNAPDVARRRPSAARGGGGRVATKALILLPTRELAWQCYEVLEALAQYTMITKAFVSGGMDMRSQELSLKHQPDIVVATPGRILDLLLNSQLVNMELLEIVVLDEADRLLDMGFKDECMSILRHCAKTRQTLLFSATLTSAISDLAVLALRKPTKVTVNISHVVVSSLIQEFVSLPKEATPPSTKEKKQKQKSSTGTGIGTGVAVGSGVVTWRDAALLYLCSEVYRSRVIVFFQRKSAVRRMAAFFRHFNLSCAELHGDLDQVKRHNNLAKFVANDAQFLLASELASRGLDINDVSTVINFHPAWDVARHVHRVGRTARMGRQGTAVTLFDPSEKLAVKRLAKASRGMNAGGMLMRTTPLSTLQLWKEKATDAWSTHVKQSLHAETIDKELQKAEASIAFADKLWSFSGKQLLKEDIETEREWHITSEGRKAASKNARERDEEMRLEVHGTSRDVKGAGSRKRQREDEPMKGSGVQSFKKAKRNSENKMKMRAVASGNKKLTRKEREVKQDEGKVAAKIRNAKRDGRMFRTRVTHDSAERQQEFGRKAAQKKKTAVRKRNFRKKVKSNTSSRKRG